MLHRKLIHISICQLFQTNECERDQESCWFNHYVTKQNETLEDVISEETVHEKAAVSQAISVKAMNDFFRDQEKKKDLFYT